MMLDGDEDLNRWLFIEVAPIEGKCDDEELEEFFVLAMETKVQEVETEIVVGGMGALSSETQKKEHGFHLVEWTKKPYALQSPTKVFGVKDKVAAGQVVCEGVFWSRVDHSTDWYEPQEKAPGGRIPKKIFVLLSHVLTGKVCFKTYRKGQHEPAKDALVSSYNKPFLSKLIRLGAEELDFIQAEQMQREGLEIGAAVKIEKKGKGRGSKKAKGTKQGKGTKRKASEMEEEWEKEEGGMDDEDFIDPSWE